MTIVLAFDLETVPDVAAGRRLYGLVGNDLAVAEAMLARRREETDGRTDFLKPGWHKVVGLGAVAIILDAVPQVSLKSWAGEDERVLLIAFLDCLRKEPQLVSWNGSGFDLPVIRYRALIHGLSARTLYGPVGQRSFDSYGYRYGEAHVDLMEVLAGYGASPAHGLDETARLAGLPGKIVVTGEDVTGLALAGDWARIERYAGHDAVQTMLLFLRWQVGRGRITSAVYLEALKALWAKLRQQEEAIAVSIEDWIGQATAPAQVGAA